jgi:aryl-alcohol dehydrogenase-like predicted oxidoreductase
MGVIVWAPLCRGWLTGKYSRDAEPEQDSRAGRAHLRGDYVMRQFDRSRTENQRKFDAVDALRAVADKAGLSMTHMAIAFTLAHPGVTSAILGPRTMDQIQDLLAGADVRLDAQTLDAIDEIVPPGELIDANDRGYDPPWLEAAARRR